MKDREAQIKEYMVSMGVTRERAELIDAYERGEYKGDLIVVDEDGNPVEDAEGNAK